MTLKLICTTLFILVMGAAAFAGGFEDGIKAAEKGDFKTAFKFENAGAIIPH